MRVAGMISGTSADGIDVAVVRITGSGWKTRLKVEAFQTVQYPPRVREALLASFNAPSISTAEISQLNFLVGELFARALLKTCRKGKPDLVGSHGQTIYHQAEASDCHGFRMRSTLQIGEPAVIAERTGAPVVADFRTADMAAGGQAAPLVPYLDYLLMRHPTRTRVALNIGGIANITAIPAKAKPEDVRAFDTGPGNMVMDQLSAHFSGGRLRFDRNGAWAARGQVRPELLKRLLGDAFIRRRPPRTAGREQYGVEYVKALLAEELSPEDLLATMTAVTADSITAAIRRFRPDDVVASGGGIHNRFLMDRLKAQLPGVRFLRADDFGVPGDAKEAVLFALLAYETWHRRPSNVPSATGARRATILGKLVFA